MSYHLLIKKAYKYPLPKQVPNMDGYYYDHEKGYWISKTNNLPVILDKNFIKPRTKKEDRETGEDQKGE